MKVTKYNIELFQEFINTWEVMFNKDDCRILDEIIDSLYQEIFDKREDWPSRIVYYSDKIIDKIFNEIENPTIIEVETILGLTSPYKHIRDQVSRQIKEFQNDTNRNYSILHTLG